MSRSDKLDIRWQDLTAHAPEVQSRMSRLAAITYLPRGQRFEKDILDIEQGPLALLVRTMESGRSRYKAQVSLWGIGEDDGQLVVGGQDNLHFSADLGDWDRFPVDQDPMLRAALDAFEIIGKVAGVQQTIEEVNDLIGQCSATNFHQRDHLRGRLNNLRLAKGRLMEEPCFPALRPLVGINWDADIHRLLDTAEFRGCVLEAAYYYQFTRSAMAEVKEAAPDDLDGQWLSLLGKVGEAAVQRLVDCVLDDQVRVCDDLSYFPREMLPDALADGPRVYQLNLSSIQMRQSRDRSHTYVWQSGRPGSADGLQFALPGVRVDLHTTTKAPRYVRQRSQLVECAG